MSTPGENIIVLAIAEDFPEPLHGLLIQLAHPTKLGRQAPVFNMRTFSCRHR
jgi:hypothetical protein